MIKKLLKSASVAIAVTVAGTASAQMTGGSVFLKGQYVEAGICANGDFGAASAPSGYHPHMTSAGGGNLGFVADPAMDGWTVGTPAYAGDYFTPGSPFEGWNLQIGSVRAQAHSCGGFTGTGLSGANTGYSVSGSKVIGTWEGTFDSMTVKQVTTLDTNALYFSLRITLTNNASVPKNNIYYLRSLDPDNDQSWPGGSFATNNTIQYQRPNPLNATVVKAVGLSAAAPVLSLGTADTNARCLIYAAWPISSSTDLSTLYSGSYAATYAMGATYNGDVAVGIVFKIDHLAPVDSASDSVGFKPTIGGLHPANQATFTYFYAFSDAATDSAITELTNEGVTPPPPPPTAVNEISAQTIAMHPNPAHDMINVTGLNKGDKVALYDMMGRVMSSGWQPPSPGANTYPLTGIPAGNYLLIIRDEFDNARAQLPLRKQ